MCPETNRPLASVTTIISATADKSFLEQWKKRVGEKEADKQREYGANLGSLVHEHIENHLLSIARPRGTAPMRLLSERMANKIIEQCIPHVDEVWGIETPLYCKGLFAGTSDLVGVYKGVPSIMDHKNAKKMRNRKDIIDYRDQLSAYMLAHNEKYGTNIHQGVVFMVDRSLECQTFVWSGLEIDEGQTSFMHRFEKYLEQ